MSLTRVVITLAGILLLSGVFIQRASLASLAYLNQPPATVTLGGLIRGPSLEPMQGATVVMFEKPATGPASEPVVVATTTSGADGRYSVIVEAKCNVVYEMKPFLTAYNGTGSSSSGCVLSDHLGLNGTLSNDRKDKVGPASPCQTVGGPVDVTTGNMYLEQTDYEEPRRWPSLRMVRSYNSLSAATSLPGLFGSGWSTDYDQFIAITNDDQVRLFEADGRATYFTRTGGVGPFLPVNGDAHAEIVKNANGTYTITYLDGTVLQFSVIGKLLSMADRNNNQLTLTYNANGVLTSLTDPFGRSLSITTNSAQRVTAISDSAGIIANYTYDVNNSKLTSVTYADGSKFTYTYSGTNLTTVKDKLGNIIESHIYDIFHRAVTSERHGGVEKYTLNYETPGRTDVTDALGHVTKYFFNSIKGRNRLTRVEGICNCGNSQIQTWAFDDQLNLSSKTDALNHTVTYTYDGNGNRLTETDATGIVTFTYNQFGEVLTRTDQMNGVTTNTYDAQGNLLTTKDALNNTTTFTYDARGQLLTMKDARENVTTFTWDASGRLSQRKDALNQTTDYAYDARSRLINMTNALNQTTTYEYDPVGRLKKLIYPDGNFFMFTYDQAGRRTKFRDPRNKTTNFAYDSAYRLIAETSAIDQITSYGYDLMSNLTSVSDALTRVTNYEYDDFNRLKKVIYPPATAGATRLELTIEYDAASNITKKIDTAGRETTYLYDAVNRLIRVTEANQQTNLEYNARSQNTAVVDALNQRYTFDYDPLGRVTGMTRAGVSMSYVYDAVGNRTLRTDYNGAITDYAYDNLNRLTTINYPDTTTATYGYDALSRLTSASNQHGTVTFGYDVRGRVNTTTDVWGQTLSYGYDANGNRTSLTLGGSSFATYEYDSVDRLTNLTDSGGLQVVYGYDATDKITSRTLPNGVATTYEYDGMNRLTRLRDAKGAAVIADRVYSYSTASQITQLTDAGGAHVYDYDAIDRLTSTTHSGQPNESYAYDSVGNRTTSHLSATYGYQPFNRLISTSNTTYTYNNNGNMTSKADASGQWDYTWDAENRLVEAHWPHDIPPGGDGGCPECPPPDPLTYTVTYDYDALGRRIKREFTQSGPVGLFEPTQFVYDGQDVIEDRDDSGVAFRRYLNGPGIDNKLRQTNLQTGAVHYFLADHLGSTRALTNTLGNVVEQISYDSFGNSSGSALTRYTYTGREHDPVTGQLFYRARFYDPQLGRFISEDPIGFLGGDINFYSYVKNMALVYRDPTGLLRCDPNVGAIVGAGVGGVLGILGGAYLGPPIGATLGAATFSVLGLSAGPAGSAAGGVGGAAAGAAAGTIAGPIIGGVIGAGIGGYIGHRICSGGGEEECKYPRAVPQPTPDSTTTPPPPPPGGGGDCVNAYEACLGWANTGATDYERRLRRRLCAQAYDICKKGGVTVKFPDGSVVN